MSRDFVGALLQLNAEKNISREALIRTVEEAIQSAYRRVSPGNENVGVEVDPETGKIRVFRAKMVVEEVEDPDLEFTLDEARALKADAKVGDQIEFEQVDPASFGRIHAQTAKQVVLQRLREAEREQTFGRYVSMEGEIVTGAVSRVEPRAIILELGREPERVEAILATTEQSPMEHYRIGQHVKAYVLEVRRTTKGPQIFVSRTHKGFLRRLFELEVPEIHAGTVEIRAIAREAGSRSKVAVASRQEGLDPVGATVGQRGGRVQAVVAELGGEKIDIIPWSDDPAQLVANALSPAQVVGVRIDEENRIANVTVPERMLSLAIGREGQNARLAAKMTGWRIDIRSDTAPVGEERPAPGEPEAAKDGHAADATPAPETSGGTATSAGAASAAVPSGESGAEAAAPVVEAPPAKATKAPSAKAAAPAKTPATETTATKTTATKTTATKAAATKTTATKTTATKATATKTTATKATASRSRKTAAAAAQQADEGEPGATANENAAASSGTAAAKTTRPRARAASRTAKEATS